MDFVVSNSAVIWGSMPEGTLAGRGQSCVLCSGNLKQEETNNKITLVNFAVWIGEYPHTNSFLKISHHKVIKWRQQ